MKKLILLVIFGCILYLFYINFGNPFEVKDYKYDNDVVRKLEKTEVKDKVLDNEYSKVIEVALKEDSFIEANLDTYYEIKYIDEDYFINNVNRLIDLKYNSDEINLIMNKINYTDIDLITTYITDLKEYLKYDFFEIKNLDRYKKYKNNLSYEDTIIRVNLNLDYDHYDTKVVKEIKNPEDEFVLVNKYNKIDKDFTPSLVTLGKDYSTKTLQVTNNTKVAFEKMADDMKNEGLSIKAVSAYRTYSYQENLYNNYVTSSSVEEADTYSARPGFSEHHTGLAIDIMGSKYSYTEFEKEEESTWINENAHKYGFIVRYKKDSENITGYVYEAWHLRFVGIDVATKIKEENITFDEYYIKYLYKKRVN